jgi:hypothetical protein
MKFKVNAKERKGLTDLGSFNTYKEALIAADRAVKIGTGTFQVNIFEDGKLVAYNRKDGRGFILTR